MCAVYTGAFTKYGWLDKEGRWKYDQLDAFPACEVVDRARAKNEIALVNTQTHEVHYGLESMLYIVGHRLPFLKPLFRNILFFKGLQQTYFLISYNRKVIAPAIKQTADSCVPDFNYFYRFIYVMLCFYALLGLSGFIGSYQGQSTNFILAFVLFWLANVATSWWAMKQWAIIYLGQFVTTLLVVALVALPCLALQQVTSQQVIVVWATNLLLGGLFLQQIHFRMKIVWRDYKQLYYL